LKTIMLIAAAVAMAAAPAGFAEAQSQNYPGKPVRAIVPIDPCIID